MDETIGDGNPADPAPGLIGTAEIGLRNRDVCCCRDGLHIAWQGQRGGGFESGVCQISSRYNRGTAGVCRELEIISMQGGKVST